MPSSNVITLTADNFDEEVLQSQTSVLVDFWAPWCGPCRVLGPIVDEVSNETNARVCKLNIDDAEDLAAKFGVMSIPTCVIFKSGAETARFVGVTSKEALLRALE